MRCERAQEWTVARLDGELSAWRARRLDRHVTACPSCATETSTTLRLFDVLNALPPPPPVPQRLEQNTLRAIRQLDDEQVQRRARRWWWSGLEAALPIASAAAVLLLAIRLTTGDTPYAPIGTRAGGARRTPQTVAAAAGLHGRQRSVHAPRRREPVPTLSPPPELAAAPDLFIDLSILRKLEKLQHFEAISTTRQPAAPAGDPAESNG